MKKFRCDKIVRDKIPDLLKNKGIIVHEKKLNDDQVIHYLKAKLQEEAKECSEANSDELPKELSDLSEVIKELLSFLDIKLDSEKNLTNGEFKEHRYIEYIEVEEGNPICKYYEERPEDYPEII